MSTRPDRDVNNLSEGAYITLAPLPYHAMWDIRICSVSIKDSNGGIVINFKSHKEILYRTLGNTFKRFLYIKLTQKKLAYQASFPTYYHLIP